MVNSGHSPFRFYGKVHKWVFLALLYSCMRTHIWGMVSLGQSCCFLLPGQQGWWCIFALRSAVASGIKLWWYIFGYVSMLSLLLVLGQLQWGRPCSWLCNVVFDIVLIKPRVLTNTCGESYPGSSTCCWAWLQTVDRDSSSSEMKPFQAVVSSAAEPQPCFPQYLLNTCSIGAALRAVSCIEPSLPPGELSDQGEGKLWCTNCRGSAKAVENIPALSSFPLFLWELLSVPVLVSGCSHCRPSVKPSLRSCTPKGVPKPPPTSLLPQLLSSDLWEWLEPGSCRWECWSSCGRGCQSSSLRSPEGAGNIT